MTEQITFDVEGMTCASCALRIERVLGKQDGVSEAIVNFAGQEARVEVEPGIDIAGLTAAIERIAERFTSTLGSSLRRMRSSWSWGVGRYPMARARASLAMGLPVARISSKWGWP